MVCRVCWTATAFGARIETVADHPGRHSPSAARAITSDELAELMATALALPPGWCLTVDQWDGTMRMQPVGGYRAKYGDHVLCSSGRWGRIGDHSPSVFSP